jgi:hypothetical protein
MMLPFWPMVFAAAALLVLIGAACITLTGCAGARQCPISDPTCNVN